MQASVIGLVRYPEHAGDSAEFIPWAQIASLTGTEQAIQELIGGGPRQREATAAA